MARESTLRLKSGDALSLLDGIPVAIKEEFSVVCFLMECTYQHSSMFFLPIVSGPISFSSGHDISW